MLELYKKRLIWNKLIKSQKRQLCDGTLFFIAVNNFWLGLKTSHRTILQTCCLSPSDGEISPFWFNTSRLPASANDIRIFEKNKILTPELVVSNNSQYFNCFVFVTVFFLISFKRSFFSDIGYSIRNNIIGNNTIEYRK